MLNWYKLRNFVKSNIGNQTSETQMTILKKIIGFLLLLLFCLFIGDTSFDENGIYIEYPIIAWGFFFILFPVIFLIIPELIRIDAEKIDAETEDEENKNKVL